jgi:histidyl-tRNA synthetase
MQFRAVKGMNDVLPDEIGRWHRLEREFRRLVELHGYGELRTPVLEPTALFVRSIGEATDIVEKEMFTFARSDESLTLRPEGTAGAARAYVEHKLHAKEPVSRWYYLGPMFRAERPQRGRYRQFWQAGCEILGDPGPICDAELIDMLCQLFRTLGIGSQVASALSAVPLRAGAPHRLIECCDQRASSASTLRAGSTQSCVFSTPRTRGSRCRVGAPSILDSLDDADRAHWTACAVRSMRWGPVRDRAGPRSRPRLYREPPSKSAPTPGRSARRTRSPAAAVTTA